MSAAGARTAAPAGSTAASGSYGCGSAGTRGGPSLPRRPRWCRRLSARSRRANSGAGLAATFKPAACRLRHMMRTALAVVVWLLAAAAPAFGWGEDGHRIIGWIAYQHLTPEAKAEVDRLLATEGTGENWKRLYLHDRRPSGQQVKDGDFVACSRSRHLRRGRPIGRPRCSSRIASALTNAQPSWQMPRRLRARGIETSKPHERGTKLYSQGRSPSRAIHGGCREFHPGCEHRTLRSGLRGVARQPPRDLSLMAGPGRQR